MGSHVDGVERIGNTYRQEMKQYTPLKMIRAGRYRRCYDELPQEQQREVLAEMVPMLVENAEWCDQGNYGHLSNILPTLALDRVLQRHGMGAAEARETLARHMWGALNPKPMQRLARLPFFMPLMKRVVPMGFRKGSGKGWRYVWHLDTDGPQEFHFECTECLYKHIFSRYGVLERFGPMFCHADIINYGALPHTDFIRTQTLCQGGELCDFRFVRHPKNETWQRSESI